MAEPDTFSVSLHGIEQVDWQNLQTAFGTAERLPELLRLCAATDEALARTAAFDLGEHVFHQTSMYASTAAVLPFMVTLLEDRRLHSREVLADSIDAIVASMREMPTGRLSGGLQLALAAAASLRSPLTFDDVLNTGRRELEAARAVRRVWSTLEGRVRLLATDPRVGPRLRTSITSR
jgi:hypothetical protein